jgi:hypothetical protein
MCMSFTCKDQDDGCGYRRTQSQHHCALQVAHIRVNLTSRGYSCCLTAAQKLCYSDEAANPDQELQATCRDCRGTAWTGRPPIVEDAVESEQHVGNSSCEVTANPCTSIWAQNPVLQLMHEARAEFRWTECKKRLAVAGSASGQTRSIGATSCSAWRPMASLHRHPYGADSSEHRHQALRLQQQSPDLAHIESLAEPDKIWLSMSRSVTADLTCLGCLQDSAFCALNAQVCLAKLHWCTHCFEVHMGNHHDFIVL